MLDLSIYLKADRAAVAAKHRKEGTLFRGKYYIIAVGSKKKDPEK